METMSRMEAFVPAGTRCTGMFEPMSVLDGEDITCIDIW